MSKPARDDLSSAQPEEVVHPQPARRPLTCATGAAASERTAAYRQDGGDEFLPYDKNQPPVSAFALGGMRRVLNPRAAGAEPPAACAMFTGLAHRRGGRIGARVNRERRERAGQLARPGTVAREA